MNERNKRLKRRQVGTDGHPLKTGSHRAMLVHLDLVREVTVTKEMKDSKESFNLLYYFSKKVDFC